MNINEHGEGKPAALADRLLRRLLYTLYPLIIICMAVATVVEKYRGTGYVSDHVYGSWWFALLWGALAAVGVAWLARRRVRQWPLLLIHGGLAVVLLGALVTHLTRWQGRIDLRCGASANSVDVREGRGRGDSRMLPFTIRLNDFDVKTHEGSDDAYDYVSHITLSDTSGNTDREITMNHTVSFHGITIMQSGYDSDGRGSILALSSDPVGTPLTYLGYALLFTGAVAVLCRRRSTFRRLLHSPLLRGGAFALLVFAGLPVAASADDALPPVLPRETAAEMGRLLVSHNGRVCPMQTFALDFTRKLCGRSSYRGLTAEQVVTGWMFWPGQWASEPIIKTGRTLRSTLMYPDYMSAGQFFNQEMGGYILGPYVKEYYGGAHDKFHTDVAAVDERLQLVFDLQHGASPRLFPVSVEGRLRWVAAADSLPSSVDRGQRLFIANALDLMRADAVAGDTAALRSMVAKLAALQKRDGGASLPTPLQVRAERAYNAVPFNTVLFIVNLTMGFVLLFVSLARIGRGRAAEGARLVLSSGRRPAPVDLTGRWLHATGRRVWRVLPIVVMALSFAVLTLFGALRWVVSGTMPMANGFETMLFVAWVVMLLSLVCAARLRVVLTFGFIMSGFFLLVSHISQMDPQISHVMPVLNSPLLSVHVSIIMFAFAMLSITFICAVTALLTALRLRLVKARGGRAASDGGRAASDGGRATADGGRVLESYAVLSRLFLYPAVSALTIGIFVGAIWAERSWGQYWAWDPKETWALITLLIYVVPLHSATVASLRRPMAFHVFMALAFLSIVMTYFGVNYFLGGMHSYA